MIRALWLCALAGAAASGADQPKLEVKPRRAFLVVGEAQVFTVKLNGAALPLDQLQVAVTPPRIGCWEVKSGFDQGKLTLTVPDKLAAGITSAELRLTFAYTPAGTAGTLKSESVVEIVAARRDQWESRAVAGYHQAGASSADFTQNFFFDFFIMRGFGHHERVYDAPFNLWGNVRVASSPQQTRTGETAVAEFVGDFAGKAGQIKVNELAQSAEFQAGIDVPLVGKPWRQGNRVRMPSFIAYFGASGSFTDPSVSGRVLMAPPEGSPQLDLFRSRYPNVKTQFVAIVPPDRERFYRTWGAGFRLTSFDKDARFAPPATFLLAFGQDEMISGGSLKGVVGRIDVFYPLPVKNTEGRWKCIFLFGTANLRLSRAENETPLILQPAPADTKPYDPRVSIVTSKNTRDTYRIGVGIDLVNLWNTWTNRPGLAAH